VLTRWLPTSQSVGLSPSDSWHSCMDSVTKSYATREDFGLLLHMFMLGQELFARRAGHMADGVLAASSSYCILALYLPTLPKEVGCRVYVSIVLCVMGPGSLEVFLHVIFGSRPTMLSFFFFVLRFPLSLSRNCVCFRFFIFLSSGFRLLRTSFSFFLRNSWTLASDTPLSSLIYQRFCVYIPPLFFHLGSLLEDFLDVL
jgi:hypothetical protein